MCEGFCILQLFMNKILVYLIILASLSCNKKQERIEEKLYNCFLNELSSQEKTKFLELIENYETHLVEKKILRSSGSNSYWEFYKNIAMTGEFDFSNKFELSKKIKFLNRDSISANQELIECHHNLYNSEHYKNTVHFKLYETIKKKGNQNKVMNVVIATSEILSPKDFELPYYRLITLMFIEDHR